MSSSFNEKEDKIQMSRVWNNDLIEKKTRRSQSWLENEILHGNAFDEKSGDPKDSSLLTCICNQS